MRGRQLWLTLGWLALAGSLTGAEFQVFSQEVDPFTHTEVRVNTPFERVPDWGFIPVKVTILNNFLQERTWDVEFRSQPAYGTGGTRFVSSFKVVTAAQSETEHAFMVPLASKADRGTDSELFVSVQSGRLLARGTHRGKANPEWLSVAFSNGLSGLNNLEELTTAVESRASTIRGGEPVAFKFEPALLTVDWRALTGIDAILISTKEWDALEPAVRQTVLGWTRLGGHLHLFGSQSGLQEIFGMGRINHWAWDGLKIPVDSLANDLTGQSGVIKMIRESYLKSPLQSAFGIKDFNPLLVFLILAAFAIIVGPVNLQFWAKPGQRHRLFITTPIISLSASLILLLIILFGDGLGGSGRRVAFLLLRSQPEERQAHLIQEQFSRTGVLTGRGFPSLDNAWLTPVVMTASRWTHFDDGHMIDAGFQLSDGRLGGDWFRSRSEQMHLAMAVIPSRARIEVVSKPAGEESPQLFNSLGYGLKSFWYKDQAGRWWRSPGAVGSGQPLQLEPVSKGDYEEAFGKMSKAFSSGWEGRVRSLTAGTNQFFAETEDPSKQMLPTLESIRWREDRLFVIGEPVNRISAVSAP